MVMGKEETGLERTQRGCVPFFMIGICAAEFPDFWHFGAGIRKHEIEELIVEGRHSRDLKLVGLRKGRDWTCMVDR